MSCVNFLNPGHQLAPRSFGIKRVASVGVLILASGILASSFTFWSSSQKLVRQARTDHAGMLADLHRLDARAAHGDLAIIMRLAEIREPWPAEDIMALLVNACVDDILLDTIEIRLPIPPAEQSRPARALATRASARNRDQAAGTFKITGLSPSDAVVAAMAADLGRSAAIVSVSIDECRPDKSGQIKFQLSGSIASQPGQSS